MYPLDVTMPQAGCCVAGGLEFGTGIDPRIGTVRGHRPASGVRLVCVDLCHLGREGPMLGCVIVSCIMPWRNSFPCHRMCCGPDTLQWFALSVFRSADMIGVDGHVSFLHKKKKKKEKKKKEALAVKPT